jgi:predicted nuclease of predicted toxin-antitoxin system
LRFLLDVHIGKSIAVALAANGHDVVRAGLAYADWADARLLALAVTEHRVVVTQDGDFTDLVFAHFAPPPPAIIYLRCEPMEQSDMMPQLMDVLASSRLDRHLIVIKPSQTRFRPLPPLHPLST